MAHEVKKATTLAFNYKLLASGLAVAYAIYGAATKALGDALFSMVIAALLFLSEARLSPQIILDGARKFFQGSDRIARRLIVALAVGGSALAIDIVYGLDFLPSWMDLWVKRSAPAFVCISIFLIVATLVSKRAFLLSSVKKDDLIRSYEVSYYLLAICGSVITLLLFLGLPVEDVIPTSRQYTHSVGRWSTGAVKAYVVLVTLSVIWMIGMVACVLSRYFEYVWMIDFSTSGMESADKQGEVARTSRVRVGNKSNGP